MDKNKIKIIVVNLTFGKDYIMLVPQRPLIGDTFPVTHMKEKVVDVVWCMDLVLQQNPNLPKDLAMIVYTE